MQRAHDHSSRGLGVFSRGGTALRAVILGTERRATRAMIFGTECRATLSLDLSLGGLSGGFCCQRFFDRCDNDTEG